MKERIVTTVTISKLLSKKVSKQERKLERKEVVISISTRTSVKKNTIKWEII